MLTKELSWRIKVHIKVFLNRFMLILIIYTDNNSFLVAIIMIVITPFIGNILIH